MEPSNDSGGMVVSLAGLTHMGRARKENQDTFLAIRLPPPASGSSGDDAAPFRIGPEQESGGAAGVRWSLGGGDGALFLVADGMGGAAGGATASRMAVMFVTEELEDRWSSAASPPSSSDLSASLRDAVEGVNQVIHERGLEDQALQGMGTTFTGGLLAGGSLIIAQVGDSRAYRLRNDELEQLTRDQSVVQEMVEAGAMTPEEARRSPQRNMILQALGTSPRVNVVMSEVETAPGDLFLLCSDGLCGVVPEETIVGTLRDCPELGLACRSLVEQANDAGGPDNITVLLVRVGGDDLPAGETIREARSETRPFRLDALEP